MGSGQEGSLLPEKQQWNTVLSAGRYSKQGCYGSKGFPSAPSFKDGAPVFTGSRWVSSFWIEISSLFVIETYSVTRKISHFFFVVSASARSESWRRCTLRMHTLLFSLVRALLFGTSCMQAWRSRLQLFFSGQQCCAHQHVIRQGIFLVAQVGSYFIFFSFTSTKGTLYLGKIVRCWGIVYTTKSCA